jgi:hypothetical protein
MHHCPNNNSVLRIGPRGVNHRRQPPLVNRRSSVNRLTESSTHLTAPSAKLRRFLAVLKQNQFIEPLPRVFRWLEVWPVVAEALGMKVGPPRTMSLVQEMPKLAAQWAAIVRK